MTLEKACIAFVSTYKEESVAHGDTTEIGEYKRHHADIQELKEIVHKQNLLLEEMAKKLDPQDRKFDEQQKFLSNRDQQLMGYIRDMQVIKQIAAANQNKSFWQRLFKNKK